MVRFLVWVAIAMSLTARAVAGDLFHAVEIGNYEKVKELIARSVDVNERNTDGATPLFAAALADDLAIARLLIESGANPNAVTNAGATPLSSAASSGKAAVVELLIDSGANVEAKTAESFTPMMSAAQNGHRGVVQALVQAGANVNAQSHEGTTALVLAKKFEHKEVAEFLERNGADPTVVLEALQDIPLRSAPPGGFLSLKGETIEELNSGQHVLLLGTEKFPTFFGTDTWGNVAVIDEEGSVTDKKGWVYIGDVEGRRSPNFLYM